MPYAITTPKLAEFQQQLVGTWENKDFGKEKGKPVGGEKNPLSYNIMPLPQISAPDGFILKNFRYYETIRFNDNRQIASMAEAPNRGGLVSQNVRALFYEQKVRFAEGPGGPKPPKKEADVVHIENGAWLWLPRFVQKPGPYVSSALLDHDRVVDPLKQPSDIAIAKQIAVPHGNSILALGSFDAIPKERAKETCTPDPILPGRPVIPNAPFPYPMPTDPIVNPGTPPLISKLHLYKHYSTLLATPGNYQNPHPDYTQCPNKPVQQAVEIIKPERYMHWYVTTYQLRNGKGHVINVPFEQRVADVTEYLADYWLLFKGKNKYLAYTQTMLMDMKIRDKKTGKDAKYTFPHITCNTVTFIKP